MSADTGSGADQAWRVWIEGLSAAGPKREDAHARLGDWLLEVARGEVIRRASPAYADDQGSLVSQAAAAASGQISTGLDGFSGDSRFTVWAGKFVMYAITTAAGRRFWHGRSWPGQHEDWDRLLSTVAASPAPR